VAKTIECKHGGLICGDAVEGETEDEVVERAVEHARKKHGVDLARSETLMRYLRSLVRDG
jgi:predicted small metal-binding protein